MSLLHKIFKRDEEDKYNRFIRVKIKEARLEKGWTQAQLAGQLRKSQGNVCDIEQGRLRVSAVDLMGIAYLLEKPVKYFLPMYVPSEGDLSSNEWELIHHFRRIWGNETLERLAINQIKQIADAATEADIKHDSDEVAKGRLEKGKKPKGNRS